MILVSQTIQNGVLSICVDRTGPSELVLRLDEAEVGRLSRAKETDSIVRYNGPIPIAALRDGISVLAVTAPGSDDPIAQVPIVMGEVLQGDVQTEVALLRSELDLLKAAFRRHGRL